MPGKQYYVYILANKINTVLYTGVTGDLIERVSNHKAGVGSSFTTRYKVNKSVYFELTTDIFSAISREKQIKRGSRKKKEILINANNPEWKDLFKDLLE